MIAEINALLDAAEAHPDPAEALRQATALLRRTAQMASPPTPVAPRPGGRPNRNSDVWCAGRSASGRKCQSRILVAGTKFCRQHQPVAAPEPPAPPDDPEPDPDDDDESDPEAELAQLVADVRAGLMVSAPPDAPLEPPPPLVTKDDLRNLPVYDATHVASPEPPPFPDAEPEPDQPVNALPDSCPNCGAGKVAFMADDGAGVRCRICGKRVV